MSADHAHRILVVDDKKNVRSFIERALIEAGYEYVGASDGVTAIYEAEEARPDLIILDVMLEDPDYDGLDVFRAIRRLGIQTPVIFLTVLDRATHPHYLHRAFELGADDYMSKRDELLEAENDPNVEVLEQKGDVDELLGRVRARLRSAETGPQRSPWQQLDPGIRADFDNRVVEVFLDGRWADAALTRTELSILRILAERAGRPVGRNQIIDFVEHQRGSEDEDETMTERALESHIHRLRRKLGEPAAGARFIHAVQGIGYRLESSAKGRG